MRNHQRKLSRAHYHLEEIEATISGWVESDDNITIHNYDRGTRRYCIYHEIRDRTKLEPLPLLIGDCLHNLRSSLDHLALELGESFSGVPSEKTLQDSEFLILGNEDRKGNPDSGPSLFKRYAYKIGALDPEAQAFIESLQPYQRGTAFRSDPLWLLYDLARIDRTGCFTSPQ